MPKTLRERHTEHTRRALVDAATRSFTERGYAATSIEDVVARAKVTRGALYHHFDSKLDLFRATVDTVERRVVSRVQAAAATPGTPRERVRRALDTYFAECRLPAYQAVVLREGHDPALRQDGTRYVPAMTGLVREMLAMLADDGIPTGDDVELQTRLVCSVLCEAAYAVGTAEHPAETADHAVGLVTRMLFGADQA